jgi:hypothetical protein
MLVAEASGKIVPEVAGNEDYLTSAVFCCASGVPNTPQ